jgi:hypothetical protein
VFQNRTALGAWPWERVLEYETYSSTHQDSALRMDDNYEVVLSRRKGVMPLAYPGHKAKTKTKDEDRRL